MSVEKIRAGIILALKQMADRGWENDVCYIRPDGTAEQTVERHLFAWTTRRCTRVTTLFAFGVLACSGLNLIYLLLNLVRALAAPADVSM
jgi:hypothetical protein